MRDAEKEKVRASARLELIAPPSTALSMIAAYSNTHAANVRSGRRHSSASAPTKAPRALMPNPCRDGLRDGLDSAAEL